MGIDRFKIALGLVLIFLIVLVHFLPLEQKKYTYGTNLSACQRSDIPKETSTSFRIFLGQTNAYKNHENELRSTETMPDICDRDEASEYPTQTDKLYLW